jgi:hypothetical protein
MEWPGLRWYGDGARNMLAAKVYSASCGVHARAMHLYSSVGRECAS